MKTSAFVILVVAGSAGFAGAQTVVVDPRMGGYAYDSPYNRLYNGYTQVTFSGKVTGIQRVAPMNGMAPGVTLLVKSQNGGTSIVDLGPTWFVDNQQTKIQLKDNVQVTGSKVFVDGRGVILAKLVKKGMDVLALRRPAGKPYWDVAAPVVALGPDPNVTEITGTVAEAIAFGNGPNFTSGFVLQTPDGLVTIDLGPRWFIQPQGFYFVPGANLTVLTGGTYTFANGQPIPAYTVRYNNTIYQLRNPQNGMGVWQGWQPIP